MRKITLTLLVLSLSISAIFAKPLKVYILSGQSNMQGHGHISTVDYIGEDPATAPMLKLILDKDGKPKVCDNIYITYLSETRSGPSEKKGKLTAGYGGVPAHNDIKIGPELMFGIQMEKALDEPILLIKTAWGGKSLNTDFRPPSAGPYVMNDWQKENYKKQGKDLKKWQEEKDKATGHYYRLMIKHIKETLADIKSVYPDYNPQDGYEIAGFVWFQGWNDMCDSHTYPQRDNPERYAEYTRLMALFIKDVRKEFGVSDMPFVIGTIGVSGDKATGGIANLRKAMADTALIEEFKGNVGTVDTGAFWDHKMDALMPKKSQVDQLLRSAYGINSEGVREKTKKDMTFWKPVGTLSNDDQIWRYTTIEPSNEKDILPKKEKKRFRQIVLPEELKNWNQPGFDDSKWKSSKSPVGTGVWKHRKSPVVKYNPGWDEKEFLLMRTEFEVDEPECAAYRISILARQGFEVYLNGEKIHTYIWWQDQPFYRPIEIGEEHIKHLKKGKNVLAVIANLEYAKKSEKPFGAVDLLFECISQKDLDYVNSKEYKLKRMDEVCTREEGKIILGASNGGYHYLGSAKMLSQIGKAFAEKMLEIEKK